MNREEIYDEQIAPLMTRIIATCKESGIPMFATFQLDDINDDEGPLYCTTNIPGENPSEAISSLEPHFRRAYTPFYAFTITEAQP